jgi:hypothetical protein
MELSLSSISFCCSMDLDNCAFVHHDPSQTEISWPGTFGPPSSFSYPWKKLNDGVDH